MSLSKEGGMALLYGRAGAGAVVLAAGLAAGLLAGEPARGDDWSNSGGNAGRNGLTTEVGPDAPTVLWAMGRPSIIAWQPVTLGGRVFGVRQTGFPPESNSDLSPVVAMDLETGAELWFRNIPFNSGDWTTFIAGARDGKVYASRSGGGGNVYPPPNGQAKIWALDAATGATVWMSQGTTAAGPYDGVVFEPGGDLIVGDFVNVTRIRASDGTTAWLTPRVGSVSGSCGVAINAAAAGGGAVYAADAAAGGHVIKRFGLQTGALQYQSPVMPGFTLQNTPFVGPDGTVYLSRTQNNTNTDFLYAFTDTGTGLVQRWSVAAGWTTTSEFGVAADGSPFMVAPGYFVRKLDAATGGALASSTVTTSSYAQRMAVDGLGRLFYSDGGNASRVYSFNADLTVRWSAPVASVNIGAPAIGRNGTLIVAGTNLLTAYRSPRQSCYANCDGSTAMPVLNVNDFVCFLNKFGAGDPYANCDGSTTPPVLNVNDFVCFQTRYAQGCP